MAQILYQGHRESRLYIQEDTSIFRMKSMARENAKLNAKINIFVHKIEQCVSFFCGELK